MAASKTSGAGLTPEERRCQAAGSMNYCCAVDGGKTCAWAGHGNSAKCHTLEHVRKQHWVNQCPTSKRQMSVKDRANPNSKFAHKPVKSTAPKTATTATKGSTAETKDNAESTTAEKPKLHATPRQMVPPQVVSRTRPSTVIRPQPD